MKNAFATFAVGFKAITTLTIKKTNKDFHYALGILVNPASFGLGKTIIKCTVAIILANNCTPI